jgi:hypothetical protein
MADPSEWVDKPEVVVLGAGAYFVHSCYEYITNTDSYVNGLPGVIGLTTALKIQEQGRYKVTIVAETLPSDPKTIRYTSHWAVYTHNPFMYPHTE